MFRSFLLIVVFSPAPLFAADAPKAGTPVAGVAVVSPDAKLVFVPAKGGGIEALDIATGKPVWKNADAPKVVGADAKRVYGLIPNAKKANEFTVVALDAATGKTLGKAGSIALPDWANVNPAYGRTFDTAVRGDGDGALVSWTARGFYAGGPAPPPEVEKAERKEASGSAKLDFATGKATPTTGKPKEGDPNGPPKIEDAPKVGDLSFRAEEQPPVFKPGQPTVCPVKFIVTRGENVVWEREIASKPFMPPLP